MLLINLAVTHSTYVMTLILLMSLGSWQGKADHLCGYGYVWTCTRVFVCRDAWRGKMERERKDRKTGVTMGEKQQPILYKLVCTIKLYGRICEVRIE